MKALVLAAGRGERLKDVVEENKCLLQVYGKPVLEFSLDNACIMADEIIIVVGHQAEDIINRYGNNYKGKRVKYVFQRNLQGLVHAIECAEKSLEGNDFALFLGDEVVVNGRHRAMLECFQSENLFGVCGMAPESDKTRISRTYVVFKNENNRVLRLVEKPRKPKDNWMGTGNCVFRNRLLKYIPETPVNVRRGRNEKELPDLVQCAIDDGEIVKAFQICNAYYNINSEKDLVDLLKSGRLVALEK